jgi:hypothetical protein
VSSFIIPEHVFAVYEESERSTTKSTKGHEEHKEENGKYAYHPDPLHLAYKIESGFARWNKAISPGSLPGFTRSPEGFLGC